MSRTSDERSDRRDKAAKVIVIAISHSCSNIAEKSATNATVAHFLPALQPVVCIRRKKWCRRE